MRLYGIGDWIQRQNLRVPHLIESIVSGDVVTRCGRRLRDEPTKTGGPLEPAEWGLRKCRNCEGPAT
jgi:hypothetical protein